MYKRPENIEWTIIDFLKYLLKIILWNYDLIQIVLNE